VVAGEGPGSDPVLDIAEIVELKTRVERLERILAERSALLRAVSRRLCDRDLVTLSRLSSGLAPLPRSGVGLTGWRETTKLESADVAEIMDELWGSLAASRGTPSRTTPE
jgi:hypothetical protein